MLKLLAGLLSQQTPSLCRAATVCRTAASVDLLRCCKPPRVRTLPWLERQIGTMRSAACPPGAQLASTSYRHTGLEPAVLPRLQLQRLKSAVGRSWTAVPCSHANVGSWHADEWQVYQPRRSFSFPRQRREEPDSDSNKASTSGSGAKNDPSGSKQRQAHRELLTVNVAIGTNIAIFVAKLAVYMASGSSALLAEAIHSLADVGNQVKIPLPAYGYIA